MKIAPIQRVMSTYENIETVLVHTGQHYDKRMSKLFFDDLQMPQPDIYLNVGSASHAEQTARVMVEFEKVKNGARRSRAAFIRSRYAGRD
jgi:UDP-N-acetylglucosamine 2-epimerase (non-hydrolysing)